MKSTFGKHWLESVAALLCAIIIGITLWVYAFSQTGEPLFMYPLMSITMFFAMRGLSRHPERLNIPGVVYPMEETPLKKATLYLYWTASSVQALFLIGLLHSLIS